jgi:ribonuclease J
MNNKNLPQLRKAPQDRLVFVPLGGTGEIGMNLNVYGTQGKWLAVDVGVTFGDDTIPGVDVVMPDHLFLEENADDLAGIVITHAHEDHIGALAYLWPDLRCPVYCSPFAAAFLETKLKEERLDGEVPVHIIEQGERVQIGPFNVEFVPMTHSIPQANMLAIRTDLGTVVHTGDWKIDPAPVVGLPCDLQRLREIGDEGVLACISDSTNILNPGHSGSEGAVRESLVDVIGKYSGRIAVSCFASNVARLDSIINAARANGRSVCLVGRSLWRIADVCRKVGLMQDCGPLLEAEQAADLPDNKVLYVCTGSQGEPRAAMARIAWDSHPYVKLGKGDVVLFSSRVIPGNEKAIFKLHNQLVRLGVEIVTDREAFIHVSGHPAKEEVTELYKLIRPQSVIPVHGEARHLQEHADFALNMGAEDALVIADGQVVELAPKGPRVVAEVEIGRLTLEGERIVPLDSPILRDRKKMIINGSAVVTLVMDQRGRIMGQPLVTTHGLFAPEDDRGDEIDLGQLVASAVDRMDARARRDDEAVRETARRVIRRSFNGDQGRKPVTDIHLVRL